MKYRIFSYALIVALASSAALAADTCYVVEGKVETLNVSDTTQVGLIEISMYDENDNEVFRETGDLVGTIVGGGYGFTELTHTAVFSDGSTFVTNGDQAFPIGVRKFDSSTGIQIPCAFDIHEKITKIAAGTGFFEMVTDTEITADGYVNTCLAEGDNENEFELSGVLCIE
jgi:hypothetical protein